MSSLYISTSGTTESTVGVWNLSGSDYQYVYSSFTAGEDVNLDQVSVKTNPYLSPPDTSSFQVGIYAGGANSLTPGSLISYLSGPGSPAGEAYNSYTPTTSIPLSSGTQYWLGFTTPTNGLASFASRVRLNKNSGNTSYLGTGWSYGQMYSEGAGAGATGNSASPVTFQIYGTAKAVCFYSGTEIKTPSGEKRIDEIRIGDIVSTSHGDQRVKWVARRSIKRALTPLKAYRDCMPTRIKAGSLGNGIPNVDLLVSGSHGLHVDGRIVNACFLENGINIYKDISLASMHEIKYFHLEFEDEVLVFAHGVGACSYADERNRRTFDNYPEFISLYGAVESSVKSRIPGPPRNRPLLEGHKRRVRRSWQAA